MVKGEEQCTIKDTEMPEGLLAYGVEIDLGGNQLGEFVGRELRDFIIKYELYTCHASNLDKLHHGVNFALP